MTTSPAHTFRSDTIAPTPPAAPPAPSPGEDILRRMTEGN